MIAAARIIGCVIAVTIGGVIEFLFTRQSLLQFSARLGHDDPAWGLRARWFVTDAAIAAAVILFSVGSFIVGFWALSGVLMLRILLPSVIALLVVAMATRLLSTALTTGSPDSRMRFEFHKLLPASAPLKLVRRRQAILSFSSIVIMILIICAAYFVNPAWLSADLGKIPMMALLFFFVLTIALRVTNLILTGPLLWDPNAEDGMRISHMLTGVLPQFLSAPILLICAEVLYVPTLLASHVGTIPLWNLVLAIMVAVFLLQLIYLYQGSSGFVTEQQRLHDKKRAFLNRISQVPIAVTPDAHMRLIDTLTRELRRELIIISESDCRALRIISEYYTERARELGMSDDDRAEVGLWLFPTNEAELSLFRAMLPKAKVAEIDEDVKQKRAMQYELNAVAPSIIAVGGLAAVLDKLCSDWVGQLRNWNLRFWYGFDMIDYVLMLRSPMVVDFSGAVAARSTDLAQIPPRNAGKTVITLLLSLISVVLGHLGSNPSERQGLMSWLGGASDWLTRLFQN